MTKTKKMLVAVISIVIVVLLSVAGTLAYLSGQAKKEYDFTVPDVEVALTGISSNKETVSPGTVNKSPAVKNTSNADAFVRVQVLVNGGHLDIVDNIPNIIKFQQGADWDWSQYASTGFVYYNKNGGILKSGTTSGPIFDGFTLDDTSASASISGKDFDIQLNVSAVQSDFNPPLADGAQGTAAEQAFKKLEAA